MPSLPWRIIQSACVAALVIFFNVVGVNILKILPSNIRRKAAARWHKMAHFDPDGTTSPDDLLNSFGKVSHCWIILCRLLGEAWHGYVTEGEIAPNLRLFQLDDSGVRECRLLDFIREGRHLVLNIGSCS